MNTILTTDGRTDGRTDDQRETNMLPFNFVEALIWNMRGLHWNV